MKCFFTDVIFECWFCGNLLCKVAVISSASFISWWFGEGCHMRCVTSVRQPCLVDEALMSLSVWPAAVAFQSALQQGHTGTLFYLPYLSRLSSVSSHTLWHVHTTHSHTGFQASAAVIQDHLLPCKYSRNLWLLFILLQCYSVALAHTANMTLFWCLCNIHGAQSPISFSPGTEYCHARPGYPPQSTFASTANRIILQRVQPLCRPCSWDREDQRSLCARQLTDTEICRYRNQ